MSRSNIVLMSSLVILSLVVAMSVAKPTAKAACLVADDSPCRALLNDGLYREFNVVKTGSISQDFKTYFASDLFKRHFKERKWGGAVSVLVEGVPVGLSGDASEQQVSDFQQKVSAATQFSFSQQFYDFASSRIPDVELARIYADCVINSSEHGLKISASPNERDCTFYVKFRNQVSTDPMPKVTYAKIRGASDVENLPDVGQTLRDVTVVTCGRDFARDLTLVIETDRGGLSLTVPAEGSSVNADLPVGTIVPSYLTWTEFQVLTKNNARNPMGNIWTGKYSKWAPADARAVRDSAFERVTGQGSVPELRGRFLRGLNSFDSERPAINPEFGDMEQRGRGSYQSDMLGSHSHIYGENTHQVSTGNGPYPDGLTSNPNGRRGNRTEGTGGQETRPRNVAIYYYIRIN